MAEEKKTQTQKTPKKKSAELLWEARSEMEHPKMDKINTHFNSRYVSLGSVLAAVEPSLFRHGLRIYQSVIPWDGANTDYLITMIVDKQGEVVESNLVPLAVDKPGPQALGSALTYARRQGICALLGLVGEEDDDANIAEGGAEAPQKPPERRQATQKQLSYLHHLATQLQLSEEAKESLKRQYNVTSIKELTTEQASELIDMLQKALEGEKKQKTEWTMEEIIDEISDNFPGSEIGD